MKMDDLREKPYFRKPPCFSYNIRKLGVYVIWKKMLAAMVKGQSKNIKLITVTIVILLGCFHREACTIPSNAELIQRFNQNLPFFEFWCFFAKCPKNMCLQKKVFLKTRVFFKVFAGVSIFQFLFYREPLSVSYIPMGYACLSGLIHNSHRFWWTFFDPGRWAANAFRSEWWWQYNESWLVGWFCRKKADLLRKHRLPRFRISALLSSTRLPCWCY